MLIHVVKTAIWVCNGSEFHAGGDFISCGGHLTGFDKRGRRFALICDDDGDHPVRIILHRAYCRECGRVWTPEGPFYPRTRAGAPVVDLCQALSMTISCGQAATRLGQMGLRVDRWSAGSYCRIPYPPPATVAAFGINVPVSIISLSELATTVGDDGHASGNDVLAACKIPPQSRPLR